MNLYNKKPAPPKWFVDEIKMLPLFVPPSEMMEKITEVIGAKSGPFIRRGGNELSCIRITCTILYCGYRLSPTDISRIVGVSHSNVYHHINTTIFCCNVNFLQRSGKFGKVYQSTLKQLINDFSHTQGGNPTTV